MVVCGFLCASRGPPPSRSEGDHHFRFANCTHALNNMVAILDTTADTYVMVEHSLTPPKQRAAVNLFKAEGWVAKFGPLDPELGHPVGGCMAMARAPRTGLHRLGRRGRAQRQVRPFGQGAVGNLTSRHSVWCLWLCWVKHIESEPALVRQMPPQT